MYLSIILLSSCPLRRRCSSIIVLRSRPWLWSGRRSILCNRCCTVGIWRISLRRTVRRRCSVVLRLLWWGYVHRRQCLSVSRRVLVLIIIGMRRHRGLVYYGCRILYRNRYEIRSHSRALYRSGSLPHICGYRNRCSRIIRFWPDGSSFTLYDFHWLGHVRDVSVVDVGLQVSLR